MLIRNIPIPDKEYKVLVKCFTYNQAAFIENALHGFSMQLTTFPFICVIMDDCSTDGEQSALESFINKECKRDLETFENDKVTVIMAQSLYNVNCTFVFYFLKENLFKQKDKKWELIRPWQENCKYEAICEGDDYWVSPTKLADQASFLDTHPDFMLIGSNAVMKFTDTSRGLKYFNSCHETREVLFEELVNSWFFPTASLFYRISLWDFYPKWHKELHYGDDVIVMTCAIHGKVACLGNVTCVYRKGCGITSDLDKQQIYMQQQHLIFYNHLLEDTGEKYEECLNKKINLIKKKLAYFETKNKSKALLLLKYPKAVVRSAVEAIIPRFKYVIKKILY